jgi:hypothetical protein
MRYLADTEEISESPSLNRNTGSCKSGVGLANSAKRCVCVCVCGGGMGYPTHNNYNHTVHAQLYDAGMKHITNVDIHAPTIAEMTSRHHGVRKKKHKKTYKKAHIQKKHPLAYSSRNDVLPPRCVCIVCVCARVYVFVLTYLHPP